MVAYLPWIEYVARVLRSDFAPDAKAVTFSLSI